MRKNSFFVLVAVLLSSLSLPVTLTGASVALPEIAADLEADLASVQWVVNGYMATFASFMLAWGSIADLVGRRTVFAAGVAVFTAGGLVSAFTDSIVVLDVVRAVAGVGAAAAAASAAALLASAFEGPARMRAFGMFGTALGVGLAFGPVISGFLVAGFGWRAVFAVPALAGVVVLLLVPLLPESREPGDRRVDWIGTVSFTLALLLLILGFVEGPGLGWTHPAVLGAFVLSVLLMVVFAVAEWRQSQSMFDFALLANPRFLGISAGAALIVCVLIPLLIYLPSYFTGVLGMSSDQAGAALLLLTAPTLGLPLVGGLVSKWVPPTAVVLVAVALSGAGAAWLTVIEPGIGLLGIAGPLLTIGVGFGISTGLIDGVAIGSVDPGRAGTAAGMLNTARLASETVVIAVVGAVIAAMTGGRLADPGFSEGLRVVLWSMAGCALLVLVLMVWLLRRDARETSAPTVQETVDLRPGT